MSNTQHKNIPFSELHKGKFAVGLVSAKPLSPEGLGDIFMSSDTEILSISLDGLDWTDYDLSGGGGGGGLAYEGTRAYLSSDTTIPGDDSTSYLDWNSQSWEFGGDFGSFPGSGFLQPETGFYEFHLNLILDNSSPARWHLETWYDGGDFGLNVVDFHTDGGGDSVILSLSDQFLANKTSGDGGYFFIYLYQNGGVDLNVKTYSSITFRRIGDSP